VEIITSPDTTPHSDWLGHARTSKAQAQIRSYLKVQQRERSVALGQQMIEKELERNWEKRGMPKCTLRDMPGKPQTLNPQLGEEGHAKVHSPGYAR